MARTTGRDDLSIDGNGAFAAKMTEKEKKEQAPTGPDAATILEEFINRVANLPQEIAFLTEEIEAKDQIVATCLATINKCDAKNQRWLKNPSTQDTPNPQEEQINRVVKENYDKVEILTAEKIVLATKTQILLDRHTLYLDQQLKGLHERGEFPMEKDFPSLLRPQVSRRIAPGATADLNSQMLSTRMPQRTPNQNPGRPVTAQAQPHAPGGITAAPPTAAALLLQQQRAREASLGAKRQKLTGGVGIPATAGVRHPSTPGTPRAGTPSAGGRAGSVPRGSQKTGVKKVAPQSSRHNAMSRQKKQAKSSLARVKRAGNKNSPSSTNDSDMSDGENGSVDEDDEAVTTPGGHDGADDDMMDEGEDGMENDDKPYCTCQKVSHGNMVACDNDNCPYEWFHWSCVGLTREPTGTWICDICTKREERKKANMKR